MKIAIDDLLLLRIVTLRGRVIRHEGDLPEELADIDAELARIQDLRVVELAERAADALTWDDLFE